MSKKDLSRVPASGPARVDRMKGSRCLRCVKEATASVCGVSHRSICVTTNVSPQPPCFRASSCFAAPASVFKLLRSPQRPRQQLNHSLPQSIVDNRISVAECASSAEGARANDSFSAKSPAEAAVEMQRP